MKSSLDLVCSFAEAVDMDLGMCVVVMFVELW